MATDSERLLQRLITASFTVTDVAAEKSEGGRASIQMELLSSGEGDEQCDLFTIAVYIGQLADPATIRVRTTLGRVSSVPGKYRKTVKENLTFTGTSKATISHAGYRSFKGYDVIGDLLSKTGVISSTTTTGFVFVTEEQELKTSSGDEVFGVVQVEYEVEGDQWELDLSSVDLEDYEDDETPEALVAATGYILPEYGDDFLKATLRVSKKACEEQLDITTAFDEGSYALGMSIITSGAQPDQPIGTSTTFGMLVEVYPGLGGGIDFSLLYMPVATHGKERTIGYKQLLKTQSTSFTHVITFNNSSVTSLPVYVPAASVVGMQIQALGPFYDNTGTVVTPWFKKPGDLVFELGSTTEQRRLNPGEIGFVNTSNALVAVSGRISVKYTMPVQLWKLLSYNVPIQRSDLVGWNATLTASTTDVYGAKRVALIGSETINNPFESQIAEDQRRIEADFDLWD